MKSFKEFNEAISAARLAQLAAKGKGGAAAAKMKADGLRPAQPQNKPLMPAPKFTRPNPAAAKRNTGSVKTVAPGTGMPSSMGGRSKPPTRPQAASKGGAIVKAKNNLPAAPKQKMSSALVAPKKKPIERKNVMKGETTARSSDGRKPKTYKSMGDPRATNWKKSNYAQRAVANAGKTLKKNVKDSTKRFMDDNSAKKVGQRVGNAPGNMAKKAKKDLAKGFGNALKQIGKQKYKEPDSTMSGNLSGGKVSGEVR